MSKVKTPLAVVFDSGNVSSANEVRRLHAKDGDKRMTLVDIATGGKAEEYGCTTAAVRQTVHVRDADGRIFAGLDAIGAMHEALGLGDYFRFCRTPGLTSGPSGFFRKAA